MDLYTEEHEKEYDFKKNMSPYMLKPVAPLSNRSPGNNSGNNFYQGILADPLTPSITFRTNNANIRCILSYVPRLIDTTSAYVLSVAYSTCSLPNHNKPGSFRGIWIIHDAPHSVSRADEPVA